MKHYVIYIPGFGDHRPYGQDKLIRLWKLWGVDPVYSPVYWNKDEPYKAKLGKLTKLVDKLCADDSVAVVGVSAGASMAMNLYAARKDKISRVVFIAGKLLYPETIQEIYFQKHPAFRDSVFEADTNFKTMSPADKSKMLTMFALADNTVPVKASKLPAVLHKRIIAAGHIPAIYIALLFHGPQIARFIKRHD